MKKILAVSFIALILSGCGVFYSPETAYKQITEYANKKDWGAVYDSFDGYSKGQVDTSMKMLMSFAMAFTDKETNTDLSKLTGRDLFIKMAENAEVKAGDFVSKPNYKIIKTIRSGDKATLYINDSEGILQLVAMVLENNRWKMHLEQESDNKSTVSLNRKRLTFVEKTEKAKQEKLAKESREKEEAEKTRLKQIVTLALLDKTFVSSDPMNGRYSDHIAIKVALENNGDKDIRAMKGTLVFKDVFGDEIYSSGFKFDEGIKAHSKKIWDGGMEYNQFINEHQRFRNADMKNLSLEWQPLTIIFEDGSQLGE